MDGSKPGERFGGWKRCPYKNLSLYLVGLEYGFNLDVLEKNCPNVGHGHDFQMRQIGGKRPRPNWTRSGTGDT
eukprot:77715-Ditylum_brightwellii.AAC.1